jgi:hypothetical protein
MSLKATIERIKALETEKSSLLAEIENLKKLVEQKAAALEREVGVLREEAKSLKTLVSVPEVGQK